MYNSRILHISSTSLYSLTWVQYSTVQYSSVQFSSVQFSSVQYSTVKHSTVQYSKVQYTTLHYSTLQYSTVQHSTVQYNTVQYSTVQYSNTKNLFCLVFTKLKITFRMRNTNRRSGSSFPSLDSRFLLWSTRTQRSVFSSCPDPATVSSSLRFL